MFKKFSIKRPKKFTGKDGTEKTMWLDVGTIIMTDEKKGFVELNHTSERLSVFLIEPKEEKEVVLDSNETVNIPF